MSRIVIALGADAPSFTADAIIDGELNKNVMFAPREHGFKLLFFYTGDFKEENARLIKKLDTFHETGYTVYGVSVDSIDVHMAWLDSMNMKTNYITLFTDVSRRISAVYSALSSDGPSIPSIYIIDNFGKLRFIQYTDAEMDLELLCKMVEGLKS